MISAFTSNYGIKSVLSVIGVVFAFSVSGCFSDAPRDNPLDPAAGINISGHVNRFYTSTPIAGATLMLQPGNMITLSNADGIFVLDNLVTGDYHLFCQAPGFQGDSVALTIAQSSNHTFKLNALPTFDSITLRTFRLSRFFPTEDAIWMELQVTLSDQDDASDIEQVTFEIPDLAIADSLLPLSPTPQQRSFSIQVEAMDLGVNSLDQLIGKPIRFIARDRPGAVVSSSNQFLTRIINYTPTVQFPKGETVNTPFDFVWDVPAISFTHTLRIEIRRLTIGNFSVLIDEISDISSSSTRQSYSQTLESGQYFWYLYIVDEFGNESRSKENPFQIN